MADDGKKGTEEPLEPHIFQRGMGPDEATSKLEGLLSGVDLDGDLTSIGGTEEGDADDGKDDSPAGDQDGREEDPEGEEDDDPEGDEPEGDEWDEDDDDDEDDDEDPELYSVKVDGKTRQVSFQDLLDGYGYQAHNTQTAQQLATERTALETETVEVRQSREAYASALESVESALTAMQPEEPNWEELQEKHPESFAIEHANWQRHEKQVAEVRAEREKVQTEQVEDYTKQLREYRASEAVELLEAIPEWKDESKMKAGTADVAAYARSVGYSDEEIGQVMDHRAILIMRNAMLFERSTAKGKAKVGTKGKRPGKGKTLKPGVSHAKKPKATKRAKDARRRLRQTGRVADATDFLKQVLPEDF